MRSPIAARALVVAGCCAGLLVAAPAGARAAGAGPAPALAATGAALYAPATGQLLYGLNPRRRLAIASTTKLMTALVTLRHVRHLGVMLTQNDWYPSSGDSQIGLVPGERMSVHDLLLALMLPSADDAAEDLAYNIGHGSVSRFVAMMNAQARALHLSDTHYSTPIGLDTPGNWSSAADLVRLAAYDLSHSRYFARIVALGGAVLHSGRMVRSIVNRNDLVREYGWINGVKTGHTADAGYVLVASGHRDGMTLISAVLGTPSEQSRDASTLALLDYGFGAFRVWTPVRRGQVLARPRVRGAPGRATLVAASGWTRILPRAAHVRVVVRAPRELTAPLAAGAVVGGAAIVDGHRVLARVALRLAGRLAAPPAPTLAARLVGSPPIVIGIAAMAAAMAAFGGRRAWCARRRRQWTGDRSGRELEVS